MDKTRAAKPLMPVRAKQTDNRHTWMVYCNLHSDCLTSDQNYLGIDVEGSGGDDPDELSGGAIQMRPTRWVGG